MALAEHTPDTATIRHVYADYWHDEAISSGSPTLEQNRAEFDAWLNKIRADAWDEGYENAFGRAMEDDWPMVRPNPYKESTDGT